MNQRTASGPWSRFKKRLRDVFRTTDGGGSNKTVERRPLVADAGRRAVDAGGTSAASGERKAELKLKRTSWLYAESMRKNARMVAGLCDAELENCRLKVAAFELEQKLCDATARAYELEVERVAWPAVGHERAAAANRGLNAALSESTRRADAAVRRAAAARLRIEQAAEQGPALSSAVAGLQRVLSSPVIELRAEALQTIVEKLLHVLEATSDGTEERESEDDETEHDQRE